MPLFSAKGFSQSAQAGFQQGFAAQVQMMLQARAEQIQRDLQNDRLKADAEAAAANREAQVAAQDKQIAADMSKTQYTEGMANNRQERDILSRENLASMESSNRVADRIAAENAATSRQDKQLGQQQSQFDAEMQAKRDEAAQRAAAQGEQIGMQREQLGNEKTRLGLEQSRIDAENKRYDTANRIEVAKSISALLERHADKAQSLIELRTKLAEGSVEEFQKTVGELIKNDPTGTMEKKYMPILQGIVQGTGDRVQASIDAATDYAKQHLAANDPALKILMDAAPGVVDEQLRKTVENLSTSSKETLPGVKEKQKPTTRTDLGPLPSGDVSMTKEQRSAKSRGEAQKVFEGTPVSVGAPKDLMKTLGLEGKTNNELRDSFGLTLFASDKEVQKKAQDQVADVWNQFTESKDFYDRIEAAWGRAKKYNNAPDSLVEAMSDPKMSEKITSDAFGAWWNWRSSMRNSDNWALTGRYP